MTDNIVSDKIIPLLYEKDNKNRKIGAEFSKCIFHLHSPESFDFGLKKKNQKWQKMNPNEILRFAKEQKLMLDLNNLEELGKYKDNIFISEKEVLAFLLVAHQLLINNIEMVVITDHNTINGFEKLKEAIKILKDEVAVGYDVYTEVVLGVEISCSDKNHIVGIFDCGNETQISELKKWLDEYIMSEKDGTYLNSREVLQFIHTIGGIGYIAHLNTTDIFKEEYLSGTYKKNLFELEYNTFIGISVIDKASYNIEQIRRLVKRDFNYILDEDSHCISEIASKPFWIKGAKLNFETIYNAIRDFDISFLFEDPQQPESYIKSLYIEGKGMFFDYNKNEDYLIIPFSKSMNSLIGGRGCGKSTILNIIELLISQTVENKRILRHIMKQGNICISYKHFNQDYYILFHSGGGDSNDNKFIEECFPESYYSIHFDTDRKEKQQRKKLIHKRIQVYTYESGKVKEITAPTKILNSLFARKFSINNLVNIASDSKSMSNFVIEYMSKHQILGDGIKIGNGKKFEWLIHKYYQKDQLLNERYILVSNIIDEFNKKQESKIKIQYIQKKIHDVRINWREILMLNRNIENGPFLGKYRIENRSIVDYMEELGSKTDIFETGIQFYNKNYDELKQRVDLKKYQMKKNTYTIENDLQEINDTNIDGILKKIRKFIIDSISIFIHLLNDYFLNVDSFSLEFNINNRELSQQKRVDFKPVDEISMGQKVVAMLSFILGYSEFIDDTTPLIIDQPEDNLDNQYIYRNLVQDFRKIKSSRQIIISTHNSTIVVNSGCDNVIVLESDNERSWISKNGYSQERRITNEIINKLEGGKEAFKRKNKIYEGSLN